MSFYMPTWAWICQTKKLLTLWYTLLFIGLIVTYKNAWSMLIINEETKKVIKMLMWNILHVRRCGRSIMGQCRLLKFKVYSCHLFSQISFGWGEGYSYTRVIVLPVLSVSLKLWIPIVCTTQNIVLKNNYFTYSLSHSPVICTTNYYITNIV